MAAISPMQRSNSFCQVLHVSTTDQKASEEAPSSWGRDKCAQVMSATPAPDSKILSKGRENTMDFLGRVDSGISRSKEEYGVASKVIKSDPDEDIVTQSQIEAADTSRKCDGANFPVKEGGPEKFAKICKKVKPCKYFHCSKCAFITLYQGNLVQHEAARHQVHRPGLKLYKCAICDYTGLRGDKYRIHMRKHLDADERAKLDPVTKRIATMKIMGCKKNGFTIKRLDSRKQTEKSGKYASHPQNSEAADTEEDNHPLQYTKRSVSMKKMKNMICMPVSVERSCQEVKFKVPANKKSSSCAKHQQTSTSPKVPHEAKESRRLSKGAYTITNEGKVERCTEYIFRQKQTALVKNNLGLYRCNKCEFATADLSSIQRHHIALHRIKSTNKVYTCNLCNMVTTHGNDFKKHTRTDIHQRNLKLARKGEPTMQSKTIWARKRACKTNVPGKKQCSQSSCLLQTYSRVEQQAKLDVNCQKVKVKVPVKMKAVPTTSHQQTSDKTSNSTARNKLHAANNICVQPKKYRTYQINDKGKMTIRVWAAPPEENHSVMVKDKNGSYVCNECQFETTLLGNIQRHCFALHRLGLPRTVYNCSLCDVVTTNSRDFSRHVGTAGHKDSVKLAKRSRSTVRSQTSVSRQGPHKKDFPRQMIIKGNHDSQGRQRPNGQEIIAYADLQDTENVVAMSGKYNLSSNNKLDLDPCTMHGEGNLRQNVVIPSQENETSMVRDKYSCNKCEFETGALHRMLQHRAMMHHLRVSNDKYNCSILVRRLEPTKGMQKSHTANVPKVDVKVKRENSPASQMRVPKALKEEKNLLELKTLSPHSKRSSFEITDEGRLVHVGKKPQKGTVIQTKHGLFQCDICKLETSTIRSIQRHRMALHRLSSTYNVYKCSLCNMASTTPWSFKRHTSSGKHRENLKLAKKGKPTLNQTFSWARQGPYQANVYNCSLCDTTSSTPWSFKRHMSSGKHRENLKLAEEGKPTVNQTFSWARQRPYRVNARIKTFQRGTATCKHRAASPSSTAVSANLKSEAIEQDSQGSDNMLGVSSDGLRTGRTANACNLPQDVSVSQELTGQLRITAVTSISPAAHQMMGKDFFERSSDLFAAGSTINENAFDSSTPFNNNNNNNNNNTVASTSGSSKMDDITPIVSGLEETGDDGNLICDPPYSFAKMADGPHSSAMPNRSIPLASNDFMTLSCAQTSSVVRLSPNTGADVHSSQPATDDDRVMDDVSSADLLAELVRRHAVKECTCGTYFLSKGLYRLHTSCHGADNPMHCGFCPCQYENWYDFFNHLYNHDK